MKQQLVPFIKKSNQKEVALKNYLGLKNQKKMTNCIKYSNKSKNFVTERIIPNYITIEKEDYKFKNRSFLKDAYEKRNEEKSSGEELE